MNPDERLYRRRFLTGLGAAAFATLSPPIGAFAQTTRQVEAVKDEYDYVVVGAGSAGCVVANRLSADPAVSVLLIEAGGPDDLPEIHDPRLWASLMGSSVDWGYKTEPQRHLDGRVIPYARGKVIGGSSSINAMGHLRGNSRNYDDWAVENPGWSHREMLAMFIKSEDFSLGAGPYHGAGGPLSVVLPPPELRNPVAAGFLQATVELGHAFNADANGPQMHGGFWNQMAVKDLRRDSSGTAYLAPAMSRPNLTVLTEAALLKLDITKGRCDGITYDHAGTAQTVRAAREVILSTGAIDTPKFLMLAGIGPAAPLTQLGIDVIADLPGVGRNLHDHPIVVGAVYEAKQAVPLSHFSHGEGMLLTESGLKSPVPDLMMISNTAPAKVGSEIRQYAIVAAAMVPESRGSITLRSTDPRAAAVIDPNFLSAERDLDVLERGFALAQEIGAAKGLSDWRLRETLPGARFDKSDTRHFIEQNAGTFNHAVGTCRMGRNGDAVVDHTLRVHGVEGLRIVDASIMPKIPNAMPNATIIAIAEKAAMLIRAT
jgi:choline dehydrogenase-like flavoprotein